MLVLHGELDIATTPELVEMLQRLGRQGHAVAVDLAEVTFMDSTGLTALMDAHLAARDNGWVFEIRRASPAVRRVFELAGVNALRERDGGDVNVMGSAQLVRSLLEADLVDEMNLMIEPIVLGGGKTIFPTDGTARPFELVSSTPSTTGVQVSRYQRAR